MIFSLPVLLFISLVNPSFTLPNNSKKIILWNAKVNDKNKWLYDFATENFKVIRENEIDNIAYSSDISPLIDISFIVHDKELNDDYRNKVEKAFWKKQNFLSSRGKRVKEINNMLKEKQIHISDDNIAVVWNKMVHSLSDTEASSKTKNKNKNKTISLSTKTILITLSLLQRTFSYGYDELIDFLVKNKNHFNVIVYSDLNPEDTVKAIKKLKKRGLYVASFAKPKKEAYNLENGPFNTFRNIFEYKSGHSLIVVDRFVDPNKEPGVKGILFPVKGVMSLNFNPVIEFLSFLSNTFTANPRLAFYSIEDLMEMYRGKKEIPAKKSERASMERKEEYPLLSTSIDEDDKDGVISH